MLPRGHSGWQERFGSTWSLVSMTFSWYISRMRLKHFVGKVRSLLLDVVSVPISGRERGLLLEVVVLLIVGRKGLLLLGVVSLPVNSIL